MRKVLWLSALFSVFIIPACKKETNALGGDVLPPDDQLSAVYVDTFTIYTSSIKEDSVRTDETSRGLQLLGQINDPVMGISNAAFAFQLQLPANDVNIGSPSGITFDSLVLSLDYESYYGRYSATGPADQQTITFYELSERLYIDSPYYAGHQFQYYATPAGKLVNYTINTRDSISTGSSKEPASLRVKLSSALGQKLINASGTSDLQNNENFTGFLKGLFVTTENNFTPGNGAITVFNLLSAYSKLTLYYTDTASKSVIFPVNGNSARVNVFSHNHAGTPASTVLSSPSAGNTEFYVQAMAGMKGEVKIPYLENLAGKDIIINKAEIVFPVNTGSANYSTFVPPDRLVLVAAGPDSSNLLLTDFAEGEEHFGGNFDPATGEYRFNMGRELNQIIAGNKTNNGFYLLPAGNVVTPRRVALFGGTNPNTRPRLIVYYTKF